MHPLAPLLPEKRGGRNRAGGEKFGVQHTSVSSVRESVFEGLFSSSAVQSSSNAVRCRTARAEPAEKQEEGKKT